MDARAQEWFLTRTSQGASWCRETLAIEKGDLSIGVVLPARNEAATVGTIVERIHRELVERVALIDEVVVVDSGSIDATAELAAAAGARVVTQSRVLPHLGDVPGKGEALWKSLYATTCDVLVFIDADLREFDAQVVVALVGPLITNARTGFVKAIYDRPLSTTDRVLPAGGGRVTELVARPLLNLYWPELAGFIQPLVGEYAARRELLEQISFASGYGVEIAMLIDLLELAGLDAMAQVDMGRRVHRNQSDEALGRMASQVMLTVLSRLEAHGKAVLVESPATILTQFHRAEGLYSPSVHDVGVTERLPMLAIPAYTERLRERER